MKTNKVIYFIVEGKSDKIYIDKFISNKYKHIKEENSKISIIYTEVNGKGNLTKKIKALNSDIVVIVFDTDDVNDILNNKKNNEIIDFCNKKNYRYIFFNINIENIFINKIVSNNNKMMEANKFKFDNSIKIKKSDSYINLGSNIEEILDDILNI